VQRKERIRSEFDQIAELSSSFHDHLGPYEAALLRNVPEGSAAALDIGCGSGEVARQLAARCQHVVGIDLSPRMIELARNRSAKFTNVEFHIADVADWLKEDGAYDCVTSMAVLHHMDIEPAIERIACAIRPGGRLLIIDMLDRSGWRYIPLNALAFAVGGLRNVILRRRLPSLALRRAWLEHGRGETYLTIRQARALFGRLLPGCIVKPHVLWRYSVQWLKPETRDPRPVE
jgi:2-polyprenyl-3-methyl-5-hydroxy-6-metoxy-1,4-benzoquinol methylase